MHDVDFCVGNTYKPHSCIVCGKSTYHLYHCVGIAFLVRVCSQVCANAIDVLKLEKPYPPSDKDGYGVNGNGLNERIGD